MEKILVITPTLGNRETLQKTIDSVRQIGGGNVKHIVICPRSKIDDIQSRYKVECVPEPEGKKGIYPALNHAFNLYGKKFEYLTFINDDDYWLPDYAKLIDYVISHNEVDFVYSRTAYVNEFGVKIGSQTSSPCLHDMSKLLNHSIILLTQQSTLLKSELFFKIGGFDETYRLVADTKFFLTLSQQDVNFKYFDLETAAYMIQDGQLSSNKTLQREEHVRLLKEMPKTGSSLLALLRYRLNNAPIYLRRFAGGGRRKKPVQFPKAVKALIVLLPWKLRRHILNKYLLYDIAPTARIGFSYIYPDFLRMGENALIGNFNVAVNLHAIIMADDATIRRQNWITGYPLWQKKFFSAFTNRKPMLVMGKDSAITKSHLIDCTDRVVIGEYTSIGGYGTQILSHSTSLKENDQACAPITIGHHCFVGTRSIILPGSVLPNQSVLGAGAVLNKKFEESMSLYAGVPAKFVKKNNPEYKFFTRTYRPK